MKRKVRKNRFTVKQFTEACALDLVVGNKWLSMKRANYLEVTAERRQRQSQVNAMRYTRQQQRLVQLIQYRRKHGLPTVQRDLAEAMGIRRDSLNKLLARARKASLRNGQGIVMPPRSRPTRMSVVSLLNY